MSDKVEILFRYVCGGCGYGLGITQEAVADRANGYSRKNLNPKDAFHRGWKPKRVRRRAHCKYCYGTHSVRQED